VKPTVGVLITAFHRERYLPLAVESAFRQTVTPKEVVVVKTAGPHDDALSKRGAKIVVAPDCFTTGDMYLSGLRVIDSDVVSFLDDDDIFLGTKIEAVTRAFATGGDRLMGFRHERLSLRDDLTEAPLTRVDKVMRVTPTTRGRDYRWYARHPVHNTSTISVRREVLASVADFLWELMSGSDHFIAGAVLCCGDLLLTPECLSIYRVHDSASHDARGRAKAANLLHHERSLLPLLDRLDVRNSPLVRRHVQDIRAMLPIQLALAGVKRPTVGEWTRYASLIYRRREPYLVRDAIRVLWRT